MKRKRGRKTTGSKKSASKAAAAAAAVAAEDASPKSPSSPSTQENSSPGEQPETSAPAVVAIQPVPQPAPAPPPQPEKPPAAAAAPAEIKPKVYSRVKLKFRSAKVVESSSEAQAPAAAAAAAPAAGGGGNSASAAAAPGESRQVAVEKAAVALHGQMDGQAPESSGVDMDKASWKVGSIKIKSAVLSMVEDSNQEKKAGSVSETLPSKPETVLEIGESEAAAEPRNSQELELNQSTPERRRDEKELTAALEAIKKVMKMDAAEPFNIPVDPVALGIPDYLDIIDTPMDFGTICQDLERGNKYLNSEDVYKDVQYIWDNCTKYNSKGDYIIELMKRVKKGFMKYWLAAGLYSDVQDNGGNDNTGDEDAKGNSKGKPKPKRRRPGNDRHKNDCACAVCQVTRRKKEKDEILSIIDNETAVMNSNNSDQHIMEVSSGNNNPGSHDTTSSQEQPPQTDVYRGTVDADDSGNQMENIGKFFSHRSFPLADYADEGSRQYSEGKEEGEYKDLTSQEEHTSTQPNDGSEIAHQQHKAPTDTSEEVEMEDYPVLQENHSFLQLCARLFPSNQSSVFRGRHSLFRRRRQVPLKESPLHAAIAAIMKQ